jgi:hypothetical protein
MTGGRRAVEFALKLRKNTENSRGSCLVLGISRCVVFAVFLVLASTSLPCISVPRLTEGNFRIFGSFLYRIEEVKSAPYLCMSQLSLVGVKICRNLGG